MREGTYWFNLMTVDEQRKWYDDCNGIPSFDFPSFLSAVYRDFSEFILGTMPIRFNGQALNETEVYWIRIIDKYYGPFLPTHQIKKHSL